MFRNNKFWLILGTLVVMAALLVACGPQATPAPTEAPPPEPTKAPAAEQPAAPTKAPAAGQPEACTTELWTAIPGGALEQAYNGELKGKVVTMLGPFTEGDIVRFEQSIKAFEEKTGIDIQYEGTKEFEATIGVRVGANDVPDIVDFPQPGLLANFFKDGKFIDPTTFLPDRLPEAAVQPGLAGYGQHGRTGWTCDGRHLGALQWQEPGVVPQG